MHVAPADLACVGGAWHPYSVDRCGAPVEHAGMEYAVVATAQLRLVALVDLADRG